MEVTATGGEVGALSFQGLGRVSCPRRMPGACARGWGTPPRFWNQEVSRLLLQQFSPCAFDDSGCLFLSRPAERGELGRHVRPRWCVQASALVVKGIRVPQGSQPWHPLGWPSPSLRTRSAGSLRSDLISLHLALRVQKEQKRGTVGSLPVPFAMLVAPHPGPGQGRPFGDSPSRSALSGRRLRLAPRCRGEGVQSRHGVGRSSQLWWPSSVRGQTKDSLMSKTTPRPCPWIPGSMPLPSLSSRLMLSLSSGSGQDGQQYAGAPPRACGGPSGHGQCPLRNVCPVRSGLLRNMCATG